MFLYYQKVHIGLKLFLSVLTSPYWGSYHDGRDENFIVIFMLCRNSFPAGARLRRCPVSAGAPSPPVPRLRRCPVSAGAPSPPVPRLRRCFECGISCIRVKVKSWS